MPSPDRLSLRPKRKNGHNKRLNASYERSIQMTKRLQKGSKLDPYDFDGDGVVTDAEIDKAKEIREFEDLSRKHLAQLRMARWSLIGMGVFTLMLFMPFIPNERIELLTDVSNLFYVTGAGLVGAYMGVSAWMSKNGGSK